MHATLPIPLPPVADVAHIIQLALAPVFLLTGVGAFLNVCTGRLARVVDRSRQLAARIVATRGMEHDLLLDEIRILDQRIAS